MATKAKLHLKTSKKIDSPLAKYNSAGQLFCVLCNAQVKNEIFWTAHVNGKQHRENLIQLKSKSKEPEKPTFKRPAPVDTEQKPAKSLKLEEITKKSKLELAEEQLKRLEQDVAKEELRERVEEEIEEEEEEVVVKSLPEGFFDDPKEDAKARGQKFRDPQEAEWEKFVKEIASEDLKSTEIVGKEEQASAVDRELEQIEEQMVAWQRVIQLEKKAEELVKLKKSQESNCKMDVEDSGDDDDDIEYDEEMDWRNKKR